jgi:hypothetical protein
MTLGSNAEEKKIYYIPSGYRYKGYRLKEGSVIQYASLTANYVVAGNEEGCVATQNVHAAAASLGAHAGQVVTLSTPDGSVSSSSFVGDKGHSLKRTKHAGLVLYGSTKQDKPFGQGEIATDKGKTDESKIDIQVEILVEKIGEIRLAAREDVKPPAEVALQSQAVRSSSVKREYERRLALAEEENTSCRVAYEKQLLQQEEAQKQSESALKKEIARLKAQLRQFKQQNARLQARSTAAMMPPQAFGAKEWSRYFGEVGPAPPLPENIVGILHSPCPFWPDKKVKDSHLLVLIPATVNGKAFTLNLLGKLVKKNRGGGHSTQYFLYDDEVQQSLGDKYPSSSYWVLLTRDVLPGSRHEPYTAQQALVAAQSSHVDQPPYAVPCVLEAATAILSHYVRSGTRLYKGVSDEFPSTSTRCAELLEDAAGRLSPVTVGRFCARGLVFLSGFDDDIEFGVSCLRRFGTRHYRSSALLHSFGAEEWSWYFGEVGAVPPLPEHIIDTLNSACPFWTRKAVKDTHLLVLIPATVDGKPFNLNLLGELIKHPKGGGYSTGYSFYDSDVQRVLGNQSPTGSYWVLMTRDVLEDSRNRKYAAQEALVAERASETELPYVLPGALEAATVILSHYVSSGERLYLDNPYTLTRCRDLVAYRGSNYPVAVGGFSSGGFLVHGSSIIDCSSSRGVSGLLRF